jgi:hypothetical protein
LLAVLSDQRVKEQDTPPAQQKSLWARLTGRG